MAKDWEVTIYEYGDEDGNALGYNLEMRAHPNICWQKEGILAERLYNAVLPHAKQPSRFEKRRWNSHTDVLKKILSVIA
jgi:hypothetical protein